MILRLNWLTLCSSRFIVHAVLFYSFRDISLQRGQVPPEKKSKSSPSMINGEFISSMIFICVRMSHYIMGVGILNSSVHFIIIMLFSTTLDVSIPIGNVRCPTVTHCVFSMFTGTVTMDTTNATHAHIIFIIITWRTTVTNVRQNLLEFIETNQSY